MRGEKNLDGDVIIEPDKFCEDAIEVTTTSVLIERSSGALPLAT